jgi:acetyl-CoA acyltransferase
MPQRVVHAAAPLVFQRKRAPADLLAALGNLGPLSELLPRIPKVLERTTGQVMGEAAEEMARRNEISRQAQDEFALRSHQRAAAAIASGRLTAEIVEVTSDGDGSTESRHCVNRDTLVRPDTSLEKLARLSPAFERAAAGGARNGATIERAGTVTAGNSSPLTDGASAVLLMSEEKAVALGFTPLARLEHWAYVGVDPADQLLIGPALAVPRVLGRAGIELGGARQRRLRSGAPRPRPRRG